MQVIGIENSPQLGKKNKKMEQLLEKKTVRTQLNGFESLTKEIQDSQYILNLKPNWDEDGALPVSPLIYETSIAFLKNYAVFIAKKYKKTLETPSINPVKNGSIDLEWHTPNARLLINIRDAENAYYYGDQHKNTNSIKGSVTTQTVENFFAVWMTKLSR